MNFAEYIDNELIPNALKYFGHLIKKIFWGEGMKEEDSDCEY